MVRKESRMNLYLTPEQTEKINEYIVNVVKKLGRIPTGIKTKLGRMAIEEWLEKHGKDFDIDWDSRE